jgi:competence protein ComEC
VLTRLEPSILRAGVMAGFTATAFVVGRPQRSLRTLAVTVIVLVLVDPLLVWSVGFWLSAGATAGVVTAGPWLAHRLSVAGPFAMPLGVTLGAQLGVGLPSLLVFDRLPLVSVPANLLAVPAAGFVMLYGLPAALVAAAVPGAGSVLMVPAGLCVRWVDTVAVVASAAEPPPPVAAVGWVVIAAAIAVAIARRRGDRAGDRPQSSR